MNTQRSSVFFNMARVIGALLLAVFLTQAVYADPPVNDNCDDRIPIDLGDTAFSTVEATTDGPPAPLACEDGGDDQCHNDIWYKFVAGSSGNLVVSTCNQADYDTDLVVYAGTDCPPTVMAACNDDNVDVCGGDWTSLLVMPVFEGEAFLIRVGGWGATDFGTGTLTLTISVDPEICDNGIDDDLDGLIDCDDPDCVDFLDCLVEICDNGLDDDLDGLIDCEDPDCEFNIACITCPLSTFGDDCVLTQSADPDGQDAGSVACGVAGVGTTANGWARCFDLTAEGATDAVTIDWVRFGVQQATVDGININVNIYLDENGCAEEPNEPGLDAILVATEPLVMNMADVGMFFEIPITTEVVVSPGDYMWVEIEQVDDGTLEGTEFSFRPISNLGAECGLSYLRALDCGIGNWLSLPDIGFPDAHLVLQVGCSGMSMDIEAEMDLKPGSCPNSWNSKSRGKLPVALLGTDEFDVMMVDLASLQLSRADGIGGSVGPIYGPPGPHPHYADAGTPFSGEGCECHELDGDGIMDVMMHFDSQDVGILLELQGMGMTPEMELVLTGTLLDGTPFYAYDCLRIVH